MIEGTQNALFTNSMARPQMKVGQLSAIQNRPSMENKQQTTISMSAGKTTSNAGQMSFGMTADNSISYQTRMDASANYMGTSAPEQSMNMSRKDMDFIDKHVSRPQDNNYQRIMSN